MIFGALVSLISAGAYAAADEIRVAHKIRSHQPTMPRDTSFDASREYRLKDVFRRNWDHEGATLFPPKLIPFLASDEEIRDLWIEATVWQIIGKEPPDSNLRGRKRYLKFDGGWYGPQLYEYDFVARYHPEDWEKYKRYKVEQKKQAEESRLAANKKRFKHERQLWDYSVSTDNWKIVATGAIVVILLVVIVVFFILK